MGKKVGFENLKLPSSFYFVAIGDMLSKVGDCIYQIAIPLYVLHITKSSVLMGVSFAIQQVGTFVSGLLFGAFVDRHDTRKIVLFNAILQALFVSLVPILHLLRMENIYVIFFIGFCLSCCALLYRTAINSLLPCIVPREKLPMTVSQFSLIKSIAKVSGPSIAGILIGIFSEVKSLWIDSISFCVVFIFMLFVKINHENNIYEQNESEKKNLLEDIVFGLKYIVKEKNIFSLVTLNFFLNIGYAMMISMFVFHLKETLNIEAKNIGLIYSMDGIATIIVSILFPFLMKKIKSGGLILLSSFLLGFTIFFIGVSHTLVVIAVIYCFVMFFSQIVNRTMYTSWQMIIPLDKLGRVYSLSTMLENISVPIAGIIIKYFGTFFFNANKWNCNNNYIYFLFFAYGN